ncbi:MAG: DUF962 domain-containing protein [Bacteroidia bacterium]|nr:DUF962 domain-containing protein [Bacteroidia bacterium]
MRTVEEWFSLYGESHQNPTNKLIHWICIPLIMFSLIGILWTIPFPANIPYLNWGTLFIAVALLFYLRLSIPLALGMLVVVTPMILGILGIQKIGLPLLWVSIAIFVVAWIFQFIGHKIEGKKPSFFTDLQFLLIGPLWLLGFIYRSAGLRY